MSQCSSFFCFTFATEQVVDVKPESPEGNDAYAYIADMGSYGLVVYSYFKQRFWRVSHQFFHFDPMGGNINVDGANMILNYGIFGMALGKESNKYKNMFGSIRFDS